MALKTPFLLFCDCFVKNDTVKGIIGKTQGVNSANKPPTKPKKKILNKPLELSESVSVEFFKSALFFKLSCNLLVRFLLFSMSKEVHSKRLLNSNLLVNFLLS